MRSTQPEYRPGRHNQNTLYAEQMVVQLSFIESEARVAELVKGAKTMVHYKGFGPYMNNEADPPPEEMIRTLSSVDVLVFDGDDYNDNSFTFVIPKALELAKEEKRPYPLLLAFKFRDQKDQFVHSWSTAPFPADFDKVHCCLVGTEEANVPKFYDVGKIPGLPGGEPCPVTADQALYVALGTFAVDLTGRACGSGVARSIVVWGGLNIVLRELQVDFALGGSAAPAWTYYHASRHQRTRDGPVQHGLLRDVEHPMLIKR